MKNIIALIVIALVILGGYFLLRTPRPSSAPNNTPSQKTTQSPTTQTPQTETPVSGSEVTYTDEGFSPSSLQVKKGTTVTFKNNASQSMWVASAMHPTHSVYGGTTLSEHCGDKNLALAAFDACEGVTSGNSWTFKFNKVGTWKYHNHLNPSQFGSIVVTE